MNVDKLFILRWMAAAGGGCRPPEAETFFEVVFFVGSLFSFFSSASLGPRKLQRV